MHSEFYSISKKFIFVAQLTCIYTGQVMAMDKQEYSTNPCRQQIADRQDNFEELRDAAFGVMRQNGYFDLEFIAPKTYQKLMELLNSTGVKQQITPIPESRISRFSYSPDGKELVIVIDADADKHCFIRCIDGALRIPHVAIHVINPHTGAVLKELRGVQDCFVFDRSFNWQEERTLFVSDHESPSCTPSDSETDSEIDSFVNASQIAKQHDFTCKVFSPNRATLAIFFWDLTFEAKFIKFKYVPGAPDGTSIRCFTSSPTEEQLATIQSDMTVRIFDIKLLIQLIQACRYLHLKETLLVKQICDDITQKKQATLTVGSPEAQIFDVLPKPIRICLSEHIEKLPNSGMAKKPIC